eukprot:6353419-Amphidinium_carterae.1
MPRCFQATLESFYEHFVYDSVSAPSAMRSIQCLPASCVGLGWGRRCVDDVTLRAAHFEDNFLSLAWHLVTTSILRVFAHLESSNLILRLFGRQSLSRMLSRMPGCTVLAAAAAA